MIEVPVPFIFALLMGVLLTKVMRKGLADGLRARVLCFGIACGVLAVIVGLRWQSDLLIFRVLQPIAASILPPMAWLCFSALGKQKPSMLQLAGHLAFLVIIWFCVATWQLWRPPVDALLAVQFIAYGAFLLVRANGDETRLSQANIGNMRLARQLVGAVGGLLVMSGVVDGLITLDFLLQEGVHAPSIVSYANLVLIGILVWLVGRIGDVVPAEHPTDTPKSAIDADTKVKAHDPGDEDILRVIDQLMTADRLYRDPDLTLDRLARRAVIPMRQISAAINRRFGRNVSQIVNEYRIGDAMKSLRETNASITEIMFECGFQTKSNFNREFKRVTGMSPRDFRNAGPDGSEITDQSIS